MLRFSKKNTTTTECSVPANLTESVNSLVLNPSNAQVALPFDSTAGSSIANEMITTSPFSDPYELTSTQHPGWTTINTQPGTQESYYTQYDFASANPKEMTVELKLIDGTKLVDTFNRDRIYGIREKKNSAGKKYTSFKYMSTAGVRDKKNDELFEVDCSLIDLCYLLKIEYQSFSKTLLEHAVKDGK